MEIEFDPLKDQINLVKHGISLTAAIDMDLDRAIVIEDRRFDYGENRFLAYAPIDDRLHVLWFTMRGNVLRAIGLRRANRRERQKYEQSR
ncbi:MAG: BrnT family toxin [Stellaceae bacterium]